MEEKFGISTKKFMLREIKDKFRDYPDLIITNYKGLKVTELEELRKKLGTASSRYFVVKNSIAKRALGELKHDGLKQFVNGETGIGFTGDILKASSALADFMKTHKSLKVNCALIDGKIETVDRVRYLATLPSKEALLSMAVTYIKSPITGFVGALSGLLRKLVITVSEIRKNKDKKG